VSGPLLSDWSLPLRAWQRDAFERWDGSRPSDALIVATPGAGKTRFAARLAHALLHSKRVSRVIAVVPREHLKAQVARAMAEAGVVLDHGFSNAVGSLASDVHGAVVTYQQVAFAPAVYARLIGANDRRVAVLLDEVHHAGDQATWGTALRDAFGRADFRISLSGTPFRSDGTAIPFVTYQTGMSVADYSYDYATALRDGVCRALVFPLHGGEAEWISRDGEQMSASFDTGLARRHESERLRTALTQPNWVGDVLQKAHLRLLAVRAGGHRDAGGLVAAMNQEHARFVADLMHKRIGIEPEIVVSDMDDTSKRIAKFARSNAPWIVAVHMISEGVDIPRLRVGVFASNVVTEMYFRQFCGRFVRTIGSRAIDEREAFVFVPDDHRIRSLASRITVDVRSAIREREEFEEVAALAAAQRSERASDEGLYHSISAEATEGSVLDFGPLFNPDKDYTEEDARRAVPDVQPIAPRRREAPPLTNAERKEALRRSLAGLVSRVSTSFGVDHRLIHATLNQRCGGSVATASEQELALRKRLAETWLARRTYDGLR